MVIEPLLDQVNGKVKAVISLDLYGTGDVVLPLSEPSWSEADEERRQRQLVEKRLASIGKVSVVGNKKHGISGVRSVPKLDGAQPIELESGPPLRGGPTLDELMVAP